MLEIHNEYIINELNINVDILEDEFNYSQNPTTLSSSFGDVKEFVLSDDFAPYITTIGLYNDSNDLIAVAKLGKPIKMSVKNDITFKIKLDL